MHGVSIQHACATFVADYEPQLDFMLRLPAAAEASRAKFQGRHWHFSFSPGGALLRDTEARILFSIDHRRVAIQTLGLTGFRSDLEAYAGLVRIALEKMAVRKVKRFGIKIQAFLSLAMTHAEMVRLMFGTFFAPAEELEPLCGKMDDGLVQLYGSRGGMKLVLVIAPVTTEQAGGWLANIPNLEHFLEPKLLDTGIKDFKEAITKNDGLYLDIDLSRTDADPEDIPYFLSNALNESDALADAVTRKLKALPLAGDTRHAAAFDR